MYVQVLEFCRPQTCIIMSGNNDFVKGDKNREMVGLIELRETENTRKSSSENPEDSECAANSKPVDTNDVDLRTYFENYLSEDNGLSRDQLEELSVRSVRRLNEQHIIANELVRKVNQRMQDLVSLQNKYKILETKINRMEHNILNRTQNANTIQFHRTVSGQFNGDALAPIIDLTDGDEPTSPNEATSTAGSEQAPIPEDKPVTNEDTVLAGEPTAKKPSSPKESQTSVVQQIVNTQYPAPMSISPVILATEPARKPMAPAPQIKIHLLNNQVALTWSTLEEDLSIYEQMLCYQVYCYRGTTAPPFSVKWRKLLEVAALPLPMTCVVNKCTPGPYYFGVRGIDVQFRIGPLSTPESVIFNVCGDTLVAEF